MNGRMRRQLGRFARDRSGATAVTTAVLLVVLLGFAAFGVDVGVAYNARRAAQNAADSAAFSGAVTLGNGSSVGAVQAQAKSVAARNGLTDGAAGVTVAVNSPPVQGPNATNAQAVEVVITRPFQHFFANVLQASASTISARAVAVMRSAGDGCLIALNRSATGAITANGTPNLNLVNCAIYDNSSASWGLLANGPVQIAATAINLVGGALFNGGTKYATTPMSKAIDDPYADRKVSDIKGYTPCGARSMTTVSGRQSFTAPDRVRTFCGGLTINGGANVTFDPGIYVIDGGSLTINGNDTVRGDGVTFVLTGSGSNYANLVINGTNTINLTAPTTGVTGGLVFMQDRNAPAGRYGDILNGSDTTVFNGGLYFPNQRATLNGTLSTGSMGCTQLVADTVVFNGSVKLGMTCGGLPVAGPAGHKTALVE